MQSTYVEDTTATVVGMLAFERGLSHHAKRRIGILHGNQESSTALSYVMCGRNQQLTLRRGADGDLVHVVSQLRDRCRRIKNTSRFVQYVWASGSTRIIFRPGVDIVMGRNISVEEGFVRSQRLKAEEMHKEIGNSESILREAGCILIPILEAPEVVHIGGGADIALLVNVITICHCNLN